MDLTPENKKFIDDLGITELMRRWRFSQVGDPWLQGDTGYYWSQRIRDLRDHSNEAYVRASKEIGW